MMPTFLPALLPTPRFMRTTASIGQHRSHGDGYGLVELQCIGGRTRAVRALAQNPLKILNPSGSGRSAALYATTLGGGLVAGDQIHVDLRCGPQTTTLWTTQSATKVYRSPLDQACRQALDATIGDGALLVAWPDPLICFAGSIYEQGQSFRLSSTASLVLVDCLSSGRRARGERWAFARYRSRNRIWVDDALVLEDALLLDPADGALDRAFCMGRFEAFATVILAGPSIEAEAQRICREVESERLHRRSDFLCSASPLRAGAILRILGQDPEAVTRYIRGKLAGIIARLDNDPLARKW